MSNAVTIKRTQSGLGKASWLCCVFLAALVAEGCRSKMDVHTVQSTEKPATNKIPTPPVPKDEPDAVKIVGKKTFFQTRDTITVSVDKEVIGGAQSFTVLNTTNSKGDDTKATTVIKEGVPNLGLADDGSFSLDEIEGGKLLLSFYPGQDAWKGKFVYGKNVLKVVANDNVDPRYSEVTLTLQDFDVFGLAITSFADNVQVESEAGAGGFQFQGWVNVMSPPVVAEAGGSQLVNGIFTMVNPY